MRSFHSPVVCLVPLIAAFAVSPLGASPRSPVSTPDTKKPIVGAIVDRGQSLRPFKSNAAHSAVKTTRPKKGECCHEGLPCGKGSWPAVHLP